MKALPSSPKGTLVASIIFDEQTPFIAASAAAFARRFDMDLRLVHVVEDPYDPALVGLAGYYAYSPVEMPSAKELQAIGAAQMAALVDGLGLGDRARGEVLIGKTVDAIIGYSRLHRANLLMTSCAADYGLLSASFSTTLALLAQAPLPVLVVDAQRPLDVGGKSLRILLADDLQAGALEAVRRGFELASRLANAQIRQVHVRGRLRPHPFLNADEVRTLTIKDDDERRKRLIARSQPYNERAAEAGVEIEIDLREGEVEAAIAAAAAEFRPNLMVFGRHKLLNARPFLLGKLPFRQMLRGPCAILIVPPSEELFANLAFPAD